MITSSPGTCLAEIAGRRFLFSSEHQLLFDAEPVVARLWNDLQVGISPAAFVRVASAAGGDGARILGDLADAGLVRFVEPASGPVEFEASIRLRFGDLSIGLHATGPRSAAAIRETWGYLASPWDRCQSHLIVVEDGGQVGLAGPGEEPDWCGWGEIAPAIKIDLTGLVLDACADLVLHVAALASRDEAVLLCGAPGHGKSTLAVALDAEEGFRLEGDDLAVLDATGRVRALPFPATLKSGAWPILGDACPSILDLAISLRPDGQSVRYLPLSGATAPPFRRVACVLCLDRSPGAEPRLEAMTPDAAIGALLSGGWSQDRRLSPDAFGGLAACVEGSHFFRMSYDRLGDAVDLVREARSIAAGARAWAG